MNNITFINVLLINFIFIISALMLYILIVKITAKAKYHTFCGYHAIKFFRLKNTLRNRISLHNHQHLVFISETMCDECRRLKLTG